MDQQTTVSDSGAKDYAIRLVDTSLYDDEEKARIERLIEKCNLTQLTSIIEVLTLNQYDPVKTPPSVHQIDRLFPYTAILPHRS